MQLALKSIVLLFISVSMAVGVHKFYVSVTQVNYEARDKALQITDRIFIDDLEKVLEERYEVKLLLGTPNESQEADFYIQKYLNAKFLVRINGEVVKYKFLGKKYDTDMIICFMEIPGIDLSSINSIEVQNEQLMDLFEEQKNIVHLKIGERKKSFVLIRENNKGMLNLQ